MADYNSFNKVVLAGHLAKDVKTRDTKKGTHMAWFGIITNEIWLDEKKPRSEIHRVVCFGKKADFMIEYGTKGMFLIVEGKLRYRSWKDENGNIHGITEVNAESLTPIGPKKKVTSPPKEQDLLAETQEESGDKD